MIINSVEERFTIMNEELEILCPGIINRIPFKLYSDLLYKRNKLSGYRESGPEIINLCSEIQKQGGIKLLGCYHRSLLLYLITYSKRCEYYCFPESVQIQYCEEYNRIISELYTNVPEWYTWSEDNFCKDLAICCSRMFPAGCLKVEIHAGIPRSMLFKIRTSDKVRFASLITRLGGFSPYFEIHLDARYKDRLSPKGRLSALETISQVMKLYSDIRGITGSSWYYDPQMQAVSPWLSYLRRQIEDAGGVYFFSGCNEKVIEQAIFASKSRRKLYENGSYIPARYTFVWPRERVLGWLKCRMHEDHSIGCN